MVDIWNTPLGQARLQELAAQDQKQRISRTNRQSQTQFARMYANARNSRLTSGFNPSDSSADAELITSITTLRARSRALCRDSSYAKRAKSLVVGNVIGSGIGMQAQVMTSRDKLAERVNDDIETAWCEWSEAENCHTGGVLSFKSFERALMSQVFEAGEILVRLHHRAFGDAGIPLALEMIEPERLADNIGINPAGVAPGNHVRMGVEVDEFYRPQAYHIRKRHLGEIRFVEAGTTDFIERVPANEIIHLAVIDRWPQTRGEPWMHTAATRLNDMDGYSEAEIMRARAQAVRMGIIETPEDAASMGDEQDDGTFEASLDPNTILRLSPGEEWKDSAPTAPNPNVSDFMRYMLREIAAGIGMSYESLSKDYSQSNYSSSRLALLDDRDLWRFYQSWFIESFRCPIHEEFLRMAVLAKKIPSISIAEYASDPEKFEAVLFKPRGWSWIDPTKEVQAYVEAIKSGLTTVTDVIAQTGNGLDLEDVLRTRARELEMMKEAKLVFETSPDYYMAIANKENAQAANNDAQANNNNAQADATESGDPPSQPAKATQNAPPKAGRFILGAVK